MKKISPGLLILLFFWVDGLSQGPVTAGFTTAGQVCANTPLTIVNTSTGATNYYWSFCAADFNSTPQAVNIGNPGGVLNSPVFGCYQQDDNGTYYGLVVDYSIGHLTRLNFGNSLLNTPSGEDLGTFNDALPEQAEGLQLERVNGNWTAVIVGGGNAFANSSPRIVKIDFGNSLANTPTATNWGNVGGLNLPHDLFITQEGGNYYGITINVNDNTITRLSFGPDFTNPPTGVNLGNIGNINYPAGLDFVNYNGNIYVFIANRVTNSLTRLDFGNSIQNMPAGVNIGNPGGYLSYPRDISLFTACDGVYGFVVNEASNELVKLNFGTDPTSTPQATDLGNVGDLDFPHSLSNFFRVGNDIYAFIPDVSSNSLTRIRFAGCQDIPGSSLQNPPPVSYPLPGVYNINLLVDLGLPTQTSYCRQVVVNPAPDGAFKGDTVCYGSPPAMSFNSNAGTAPFGITYSDGQTSYAQGNLNGQSAIALPYALTDPGTTVFTLQTITDANGCMATIDSSSAMLINALPQAAIQGNVACGDDSARILFQGSQTGPFVVSLSDGVNTIVRSGEVSGAYLVLAPLPATTTFTLLSVTDTNGCTRTSGFTAPSVTLVLHPLPQLVFDSLQPVCYNKDPFVITSAAEVSGLAGAGTYSGAGIDAAGSFSPALAGVGEHILTYTYATDVCVDSVSGGILVNALPPAQPADVVAICGGTPVQLVASGGVAYSWSPASPLNDPLVANPVATVDTTTTFIATVTGGDGCAAFDTVTVSAPVDKKTLFILPNGFTPNGDGHNDCFGIQHWGAVSVEEFAVFNRWGGRVFFSRNPADCWDGTFNGQPQPSGAYVYVIRASSSCGQIVRTGTVMLVR